MAERHPLPIFNAQDGVDIDGSPLMIGGGRDLGDDPAPYGGRMQFYAKRQPAGYLDAFIQNDRGDVVQITNKGQLGGADVIDLSGTPASKVLIGTRVTGDAGRRLSIAADGTHSWGPGDGTTDVAFNRIAIGQVQIQSAQPAVPQFRLAWTAGSVYCDFRSDVSGDLYTTTTGSTYWFQSTTAATRSTLRVLPNGAVGTGPTSLELFGTDFIADSTNWERLLLQPRGSVSPSTHEIRSEKGGTGTVRDIQIYCVGVNNGLQIKASGNIAWNGNFIAGLDNSYDIGASGATRPRNIYPGTAVYLPDGVLATPSLSWASDTSFGFRHFGTGQISLTDGTNDRMCIVGTSFPSIVVNSSGSFIWTSTGDARTGTQDLLLVRDAAGTLAQKNGVNAQTLRIYGTTTGPKYLQLGHNGSSGFVDCSVSSGQLVLGGNAAQVVPNADGTLNFGTSSLRWSNIYAAAFNCLHTASDANPSAQVTDGQLALGVGGVTALDTILVRDGAGILAQKNGVNAQEARVYGTTTGPKYVTIQHNGTSGFIGAHGGLGLGIAGVGAFWQVSTSGHFINVSADNTFDIGASGATRPRSIYFGTRIFGGDGSNTAPTYSFGNNTDLGMYNVGGVLAFAQAGTLAMYIDTGAAVLHTPVTVDIGKSGDCELVRDAAAVLALKNSTTAQTFRVYGTTTGPKYAVVKHDGANALFVDDGTSTVSVGTNGAFTMSLVTGATSRWDVTSAGHFLAHADNTYDIGASGATRPRNIYVAGQLVIQSVGTASAPCLALDNQANYGFFGDANNGFSFTVAGTSNGGFGTNGFILSSSGLLIWLNGTVTAGTAESTLARDAANTIALKNGTNAQTFRVYGTTTGSKYTSVAHDGTDCRITASSGNFFINANAAGNVVFQISGVNAWIINPSSMLVTNTDNTNDIGASGTTRPRNVFLGGYVSCGVQCLTKTSSPYAVSTAEQRAEYDNNGAGAQVIFNLPASAVGLVFSFYVATAQNVRIAGNGTDTIRIAASVSTASTGHIDNATVGGFIRLVCHVSGQWVATTTQGTWTVT